MRLLLLINDTIFFLSKIKKKIEVTDLDPLSLIGVHSGISEDFSAFPKLFSHLNLITCFSSRI